MTGESKQVFTVGHSNQTFEEFLGLLRRHEVTAVADVRSAPYSKYTPHFGKEPLANALKANGVNYVFLGRELGARSDDRSCYENGRVQYARLAQTDLFKAGVERVIRGSGEHRIALMCAEKEPLECHRTILVARALDELGVGVEHILADGGLESHGHAMLRLLDLVGLPRDDFFLTRDDLIREALTRQEARIAYVDEGLVSEAG